jgi:GntR family transcriptional repressor for pyruvate dehydrogenase complex
MKPIAADRAQSTPPPVASSPVWSGSGASPAAGTPTSAALNVARLSDQLASRLIAQITAGDFEPGTRIPTEAQLAAQHGVSRSVVREAVHQLKSRGLVQSRQGSGVYVSAAPSVPLLFDPSVLESLDAVIEVMELRRVLEGEMAALAATRATRTQVAKLRRCLRAIDEATRLGRDGVAEDLAFHRAISEATGNVQFGRLLGFLEQYLREAMRVTKGNEARRDDFMRAVQHEHGVILDAIARGDAAAARRAAVGHLRNGERRLVKGGVLAQAAVDKTSPKSLNKPAPKSTSSVASTKKRLASRPARKA